jgi:DNA polymerase IV
VSRESTFPHDLHAKANRAELSAHFTGICQRVAADLQRQGVLARTIGIKLRFADFQSVTRDLTLDGPTSDAATIRRAAGECLKRVALDRRIRLLGVRAANLQPVSAADDQPQQAELSFS